MAVKGHGRTCQRSQFAQLSKVVSEAASAAAHAARALLAQGAQEMADMVDSVGSQLRLPADAVVLVSYSGGLFHLGDLLLEPLEAELARRAAAHRLTAARLPPDMGAVLHAAKLNGSPLPQRSIEALAGQVKAMSGLVV